MFCFIRAKEPQGAVGRAIVDADNLDAVKRLGEKRIEAAWEQRLGFVTRNNNAELDGALCGHAYPLQPEYSLASILTSGFDAGA